MTLGQNIQNARRAQGLSQEALAEKIGVSRQALGKWEKDTALPGLDNLQALAAALGIGVDALLGAAGMRDIGYHFPDTDPAYRGADSMELLRQVGTMLRKVGFRVGNIDVTMIAQKPKLKDYIPQMTRNIAAALGIEESRVNVKATTEEHLGFTGTGEGMSCHAVCLIEDLPGKAVLL